MGLREELRASEELLSLGDLDHYRAVCREDAVFVMPGMVATKEEAIAGLEQAPPWDEFSLADVRLRELGVDAAAIVYRFRGRRGTQRYTADMISTYAWSDGRWRLVLHQHTPV